MVLRIFYPKNFNEILSNYESSEHNRIKNRYNKIYREKYEKNIEAIEGRYNKDVDDLRTHCELLSCCLSPFLRKNVSNFEVLFIEPLLYLKNIGKIQKETPIWDFLLGEIINNKIIRLIFGEVKGQKPGDKDNLSLMIQKYQEAEILKILADYIKKDSKIEIDLNNIKIEFVLVVQSYYIERFISSIKDRNLPFNIWEIRSDWNRTEFQIHIHRKENILNLKSEFLEEDKNYRNMLNTISSKKYPIKEDLLFTYASDLDRILDRFKKLYENKFGLEIFDNNFKELINDIGGGKFYDDEKNVIDHLIEKLKKRYFELDLIIRKEKKLFFRERINPRDRVILDRLKKYIENKQGEKYLIQAIKELKLKKSQKITEKPLDYWTSEK
ncbi:MAG: hypothetical protein ACTSQP_11845 [Promethearchaeota archaeon]